MLAVAAWVSLVASLTFLSLKATIGLRVSEEEELEGLDIHEHGMYGYPELALGTTAFPGGPRTGTHNAVLSAGAPQRSRREHQMVD